MDSADAIYSMNLACLEDLADSADLVDSVDLMDSTVSYFNPHLGSLGYF